MKPYRARSAKRFQSEFRQRGVALISVLMVVMIATVLTTTMVKQQAFSISRAQSYFDQTRVRQYALGGEELARQILHEDFTEKPELDFDGEGWAARDMVFEFEDGQIELEITDLQGLFNLNMLASRRGGNNVARQRFINLLNQQGIDPMFADRVIDWIDENQDTSQLGAEDFEYLGLERPYRTSGLPLADVSELRLILDMDPESYARLEPLVSVIPDPNLPININTAPAGVIQSLAENISPDVAETLVMARREGEGYENVQAFLADELLAGQGIALEGLGVQSGFYRVKVRARYNDRFGYLTSIIQRNPTDGQLRVIYRNMGKKIYPVMATAAEEETNAE
ncbi:MAG: type II secretion system minor pseudopilin GspK [Pseudomonadales bacterium]|nr:type II secretion system minor pseudopilin GspK [Pseudomonadales bacterium]